MFGEHATGKKLKNNYVQDVAGVAYFLDLCLSSSTGQATSVPYLGRIVISSDTGNLKAPNWSPEEHIYLWRCIILGRPDHTRQDSLQRTEAGKAVTNGYRRVIWLVLVHTAIQGIQSS